MALKKIKKLLMDSKSPASLIFIVIMIVVYIITGILSMNFVNIDPSVIRDLGSDSWFYIKRGQIWRFITPAFFHFNIRHLLGNLYGMIVYATQVETLMGTGNFIILFFLSTISATIFSNLGYLFNVNGAGASGPIYGIIGALLILAWKIKDKIGIGYLAGFIFYMIFMIYGSINDAVFGSSAVNHWAHIGGFIVGLLFTKFVYGKK